MSFNICHKKSCAINRKSSLANCTCGFTARSRYKKIGELRAKLTTAEKRVLEANKNAETIDAFAILNIEELKGKLLIVEAANAALKEVVERYCNHDPDCKIRKDIQWNDSSCTCGYIKAVRALESEV